MLLALTQEKKVRKYDDARGAKEEMTGATVTAGAEYVSCEISATSPNTTTWTCSDGPGNYGANEDAVIRLDGPGNLTFTMLDTYVGVHPGRGEGFETPDPCLDYIKIGNETFCSYMWWFLSLGSGFQTIVRNTHKSGLPINREIPAGSSLDVEWRTSDDAYVDEGFKLTYTTPGTPSAPAPSPSSPSPQVLSPCPTGQGRVTTTANCTSCAPGRYRGNLSTPACVPCAEGSYQDAVGSTQCKVCIARSFADAKGLARCKVCQAGTTFDAALLVSATADPCASCPAGKYRDNNRTETEADNDCTKCEKGMSSLGVGGASTCTFCAPGKIAREDGASTGARENYASAMQCNAKLIQLFLPLLLFLLHHRHRHRHRPRSLHRLRAGVLLV